MATEWLLYCLMLWGVWGGFRCVPLWGVGCEGPELVIVRALGMVEEQFPRLVALAMFDICERNPY